MRPLRRYLQLMACVCVVVTVTDRADAEVVSFYTSSWDHGSGPQTGWSDGATTGSTTVGDVNVTVSSSIIGTASPMDGMYMANVDDAPNFVGFGLAQDPSEVNNGGSLANYLRLDFEFSRAVRVDSFTVSDIDQSSARFFGLFDLGYWDVVAAEGFVDGLGTMGSGTAAEYTLNGNTHLEEVDMYGLSAVRPTGGGNGQQDPRNEAAFNFGATDINAFSVYYWNNGPATDGATHQIIGLGEVSFQTAQTPEPASLACCLLGMLMLTGARRLGRRTCGTSVRTV